MNFARIYDASYYSNISGTAPSFKVENVTTGSSITVKGINDLLIDIDNLTASGGNDCPEYGMTAILAAIDLIDGIQDNTVQTFGRHNIIVLTDATPKDDHLYQKTIANANAADKPSVTVHFFYSGGGCDSEGFGHYNNIKSATGGYSVNQNNAANFKQFVNFIAGSGSGNSKKRSTPNLCQHFLISLFVTQFSNLLETSQSTITITRPDNSTDIISTLANSFAFYKVTNPQPGQWQACITSGTLQQSLSVTVDLDLKIDFLKENKNGQLLPTNNIPFMCK